MNKINTLLLALLLGATTACTSDVQSKQTLLDAGYTEISLTGYAPFACGEGDTFSTSFTALNPKGNRNVKGTVCCGLMKGCTIRH